MTAAHLTAHNIVSGYGPTRIIDGISLEIAPGRGLAILGRNGAGKTTLVSTLAGRLPTRGGEISLGGKRIERWPPSARCRAGIGLVPQAREIFRTLSVDENLSVAALGGSWNTERVYALFPRLAERRGHGGGQLSGGEQQMLAIGRALMASPSLLLLDEPFEGLAPVIVDALIDALASLRAEGLSLVIVEQQARLALDLADAGLVIERGQARLAGSRDDLIARWSEVEDLLSIAHAGS